MEYLNMLLEDLEDVEAINTAREIANQPKVWKKTYKRFLEEREQILEFVQKVWENDFPYIVFTGAGTSAFIGEALAGSFQKNWRGVSRAVSTTDIITHPENYFVKSRPTLLISFARSGDSPESLYTIMLARKYCDELYELNITCNEQGELAKRNAEKNSYVFLLPEETNDQSLAMTSSFSSMLLAGLLILNISNIEKIEPVISRVCELGNYILKEYLPDLKKMAETDFERMVFLGSGPLFGIAHESHLKVQELSNGKIICKFDSFLGFRHGPKAVVNDSTVVVYLFSNNKYAQLYERDLVRSVNATAAGEWSVSIGNANDKNEFQFDLSIRFPGGTEDIPEEFLSVFYILPAQLIGFYKSLSLGLSPDSPSKNGAISRVVQGVKIYDPVEKLI
ncbi:MAG: SIS domain-containing protein [Bacteroidales bacterium]|nr:SIS domain-containing protein [Bacteroidales bacterium]